MPRDQSLSHSCRQQARIITSTVCSLTSISPTVQAGNSSTHTVTSYKPPGSCFNEYAANSKLIENLPDETAYMTAHHSYVNTQASPLDVHIASAWFSSAICWSSAKLPAKFTRSRQEHIAYWVHQQQWRCS